MYYSFREELIKIAEESRGDKIKRFAKVVIPAALGVGVGSVAADQLGHVLNTRVQNPKIKSLARAGLMIGAPIIASSVIPQVREEWEKLMRSATGREKPKS